MNVQEGVQAPPPNSTPISSAGTNVQRLMPVLYVNQSNVRPVSPSSQPPNPGASVTSGTTILTAMPQIQLAGGGNPQLIHSSPNNNTYTTHTAHYIPVRQVYQQGKPIATKDVAKKVFVTSINSGPNNKSNQVNLILPNNQNTNTGNKSPITSLILPQIGSMSNKTPITGMILPNNNSGGNSNKPMASLLLPANTKYPNIAPNKKVPIPNIIIPQQNINKQTSVPNIIRQSNNPTNKNVAVGIFSSQTNSSPQMTSLLLTPNNNANKQPPTSVGLILPTSGASHGIIMPQATSGQTHGIIVPQSSGGIIVSQSTSGQTHSIIVPQSSSGIMVSQNSVAQNLVSQIITPSAASVSQSSNTAMTSLLISNPSSGGSSVGSSLLISQNPGASPGINNSKSSIMVPVPVGPNKSVLQPVSYTAGKKSLDSKLIFAARENKQSLLVKTAGESLPSLPPLQPITTKSILAKTPNGVTVPDSIIMTPICENELPKRHEKISDEMIIERTSSTEDKGTGTSMTIQRIDERSWSEEEKKKSDMSVTVTPFTPRRASEKEDEGQDYDITVSCLGPVSVEPEEKKTEKKQMDDEVKIELLKPERQKLPPPRYQKPEDLNPMEVLEWDHQGVGKLPGSNIKFRINEFGLELVDKDSNKDESSSNTPVSSRRNSDDKPANSDLNVKETLGEGVDKIYCCEGCGCYGLYTEFLLDTRFCSVACKKFVLSKKEEKKRRREDKSGLQLKELQLRRKRRKIKILAQRARRGSIDKKAKDSEDKNEGDDENSKWGSEVTEVRKRKKSNVSKEDTRTDPSVASETEESEIVSQSPTQSEDDGSDKTNLDGGWTSATGEFIWSVYLQKCCNKSKAASAKLFRDQLPFGRNGFKQGMKLEGIDPEHQAIISVLTVAQVVGHRIRLHFDGYPDCHDFWTNSYSPDIFPPGWCERNQHMLHPPRGYTSDNFSWNNYLKQCRAQPAPKSLFPRSNAALCPSQFRVGMKLEAVDRKNSSLICVASVASLIDNRLLIHFDSWGDVYDYWTDPSSPYIHPVGWCEENGHDLTPPNTYKNPATFSWDQYLKETKSVAAPARAFKPRPPNAFKIGMKLEAIDKRSPTVLRPATIVEVMEYQIKITFDGYPEEFGYWVDDDCPDIHPVGWANKTGHPLKPPPLASAVKSECGTKGCTGDGSIKGGFLTRHATAALCPYSSQNLNRENVPDRFCVNPDFYEVPEPIINKNKANSIKQETEDSSSETRVKTRLSSSSSSLKDELKEEPADKMEVEGKTEERVERRGRKRKQPEPESVSEQLDRLRRELVQTVLDPGYKPSPDEQEMWVKHVATLGQRVSATGGDPRAWNHKQVAAFVNSVIPSRAKLFLDQEVDGEAFLMMTQADLTKVLGLKLGPALKIYNCIILLRQKVSSL
ncbi:lethal(3)malignant brain tumor-like protein 3 isoform X2 [Macrosteles quadrilineatus]|uniref:lethal(3)malignant brain tumor-like protein 3 isoform X2 n=1 Tax=Macrosteles quadrilineatus TaxID=74068 RepID=UPI0023E27B58|nr:lethal(3)malignant brain tumor-like protein 3 isoform X2 [Macrosteles quadrilineatus]